MSRVMKAAVYRRYGGPEVLELAYVPKPVPAEHEVMVRIHATTVTSADRRLRSMDMPLGFGMMGRALYGMVGPRRRVLGSEFSGHVAATGARVTRFQVGDAVFGLLGAQMGCYAEYCCLPETGALARKPHRLSHRQAAALTFGSTTALTFLRKGRLRAREKLLVNGASGCIGSAAIQIARQLGAEVVGVCSRQNSDVVKGLGAHRVIDYTEHDFMKGGDTYDVILDAVGNCSYHRCRKIMDKSGRLLLVAADIMDILHAPMVAAMGSRRVIAGPAPERSSDVQLIAGLAELGLFQPLLDRVYGMEEIVDAHRYVDTGRKRGSVVIEWIPEL